MTKGSFVSDQSGAIRPAIRTYLGYEPKELPPREKARAISGYDLRYRIEAIVRGITSKKIKHIYGGTGAATNREVMILPRIPSTWLFTERDANILLGYAAHEISHQLLTDLDMIKTLFADPEKPTKREIQIKEYWNAIEDYRIERENRKFYPGFPIFIDHTRDHTSRTFVDRVAAGQIPPEDLSNPYYIGSVALTWVGARLNKYKTTAPEEALACIDPDLRAWLESWSADMEAVQTCYDARELAEKIVDELDKMRQQNSPSPQDQASQAGDKTQDQGEEGGDGSGCSNENEQTDHKNKDSNESEDGKADETGSNSKEGNQEKPGQDSKGQGNEKQPEDNGNDNPEGKAESDSETGEQENSEGSTEEEEAKGSGASRDSHEKEENASGPTESVEEASSSDASEPDDNENAGASGDQGDVNQSKEQSSSEESQQSSREDVSGQNGPTGASSEATTTASSEAENHETSKVTAGEGKAQSSDATSENLDPVDTGNGSGSEDAGNTRPTLRILEGDQDVDAAGADLEINEIIEEINAIADQIGNEAEDAIIVEGDDVGNIGSATRDVLKARGSQKYAAIKRSIAAPAARSAGIVRRMLQSRSRVHIKHATEDGDLDFSRLIPMAIGAPDIYQQVHETRQVNTALSILLDNSGSMAGAPLKICQETAIILDMAIQGTPTVVEITGFTSDRGKHAKVYQYRTFTQKGTAASASIGNMDEVPLGSTPVGVPLLEAWRRLRQQKEPRKIMIIVSDGGADDPAQAKAARELAELQGCLVLGIAIGSANAMKQWCSKLVEIQHVDDLSFALTQLVREHIR